MKIRYIVLAAWIQEFSFVYCGSAEYNQSRYKERQENLQKAFSLAVDAAKSLEAADQEKALDRVYELVFCSASTFIMPENSRDFFRKLYEERPHICSLTAYEKEKLGLPLNQDELTEIEKIFKDHPVFCDDYSNEDIKLERSYKKRFGESNDKVVFIEQIINDRTIPPIKRAELVWYCTDKLFSPLHLEMPPQVWILETIDWNVMKQILGVEEEFLVSDELQLLSYEEHQDWTMYVDCNTANHIIVSAALEETEDYETYMDMLLSEIGREIEWYLNHNAHWSSFVSLRNSYNLSLWYVLNGLTRIGKTSWIMPYLIQFANGWEKYAQENGYSDETAFFPLYKSIVECAVKADGEKNVPPQYEQDFLQIAVEYQRKTEEIAGIDYSLRQKEK